jgi:hypothetical protein
VIHRRAPAVKTTVSIDRFEGDRKQIAVLVTDDGEQIPLPRKMLPKGAKAGDVLIMEFGGDDASPRVVATAKDAATSPDAAATEAVARKTRKVQDELKKTDPGGDIAL